MRLAVFVVTLLVSAFSVVGCNSGSAGSAGSAGSDMSATSVTMPVADLGHD